MDIVVLNGRRMGYSGDWPPPYHIQDEMGETFKRVSYSKMTEEEADHPNLIRGAVYELVEDDET